MPPSVPPALTVVSDDVAIDPFTARAALDHGCAGVEIGARQRQRAGTSLQQCAARGTLIAARLAGGAAITDYAREAGAQIVAANSEPAAADIDHTHAGKRPDRVFVVAERAGTVGEIDDTVGRVVDELRRAPVTETGEDDIAVVGDRGISGRGITAEVDIRIVDDRGIAGRAIALEVDLVRTGDAGIARTAGPEEEKLVVSADIGDDRAAGSAGTVEEERVAVVDRGGASAGAVLKHQHEIIGDADAAPIHGDARTAEIERFTGGERVGGGICIEGPGADIERRSCHRQRRYA